MSVPKCGSWYPALAGEWSHDKDVDGEMGKLREHVLDMGMLKRTAASASDKLLKLKIAHKDDGGKQHIELSYNAGPQTLMKVDADVPAKELKVKNVQQDEVTLEWEWASADSAKWQHGYFLRMIEKEGKGKYTITSHFGFGADGKFKIHIIGEGRGKKEEVTRIFK